MIASAQPAPKDAERSRPAGDKSTRLGTFVLAVALCFLTIPSFSNALRCDCNDESLLSDCRWHDWTCMPPRGHIGTCLTRVHLVDGEVIRETRCLIKTLNPLVCIGAFDTDTDVYECCDDYDFCNGDLTPTIVIPSPTNATLTNSSSVPYDDTITSSQVTTATSVTASVHVAPTSSVQSPVPSQKPVATVYTTVVSSHPPSPNASPVPTPMSPQTTTATSAVVSSLRVKPSSSVQSVSTTQEVVKTYVSNPEPSSSPSTTTTTTPVPTGLPTSTTPPGMLTCECSESLCKESSTCITNYMCFKDVRYIELVDYVRVRLGCLDIIPEVNLSGMAVCNGRLETPDYKLACCDGEDMCNGALNVALETKPPTTPTANTVTPADPTANTITPTDPTEPSSGKGSQSNKEDVVFLSLSIVVVVFTVMTVVVVLVVLCIFFRHYQGEKSKVTSVDSFPNEIKGLSGKSPTYMPKINSRTDQAQLNHYV